MKERGFCVGGEIGKFSGQVFSLSLSLSGKKGAQFKWEIRSNSHVSKTMTRDL